MVGLRAAAAPDSLLVAPEALSRFYVGDQDGPHGNDARVGATWMTREDRLVEIDDYVAYLDRLYAHVRSELPASCAPRTLALGFSQGTQTAARWAARTEAPLSELVLWGGTLPPELDAGQVATRWARLRVTLVAGTRDRYVPEARLREDAARLEGHGVAARVLTFDGGHRLDDVTLGRIASG
jgi:predicted esterase